MPKQKFVHQPLFPGGDRAMYQFIEEQLTYPEAARAAGIEGIVKIRFGIDHRGRVSHVYIESGLGYGCDEEAERVIRRLRFVVPKTQKKKVNYEKRLQIHFRRTESPAPAQADLPPALAPVPAISYTMTPVSSPTAVSTPTAYEYTIEWGSGNTA